MKTNPSVLLVCENENSAQLDKRALRDAGYAPGRVMYSGIDAARLMGKIDWSENDFKPDITICAQKLADIDGERFCSIIRSHPLLLHFPILLIASNEDKAEELKILGCNASEVIGRPYSVKTLKNCIETLLAENHKEDKNNNKNIDLSAFETALDTYGVLLSSEKNTEDYFNIGMRSLKDRQWNNAISAFQRAISNENLKAKSELGLAAAYKGKGDLRQFANWLAKSAETALATKNWHMARTAYARLLQHDPAAKSPFASEAHRLIRQKNYGEAAEVLRHSLPLIPRNQISERFAKICLAAPQPEIMRKALETELVKDKEIGVEAVGEIKQKLETLLKEKEERLRQQAAERKWQLSMKMAEDKKFIEQQNSEEPDKKPGKPVEVLEALPFDETQADIDADIFNNLDENEGQIEDEEQTIAPLQQDDFSANLFNKKHKFNELLSVVKLTWRLARHSRKKH